MKTSFGRVSPTDERISQGGNLSLQFYRDNPCKFQMIYDRLVRLLFNYRYEFEDERDK